MDYKSVLKLGLKICVAAVSGLVIFIGIDHVGKKDEKIEGGPAKTGMENMTDNKPVPENSVIQKMRNVQGTLGKLFACVQALTLVVENLKKVFSNSPDGSPFYAGQPYYIGGNPFYYYGTQDYSRNGGVIMNRVSPFITEVIYDRDYRGI